MKESMSPKKREELEEKENQFKDSSLGNRGLPLSGPSSSMHKKTKSQVTVYFEETPYD
jgi:hypothetical protein